MNTDAKTTTATTPTTVSRALRDFRLLARAALRRPRSMRAWVRCWADVTSQPSSRAMTEAIRSA